MFLRKSAFISYFFFAPSNYPNALLLQFQKNLSHLKVITRMIKLEYFLSLNSISQQHKNKIARKKLFSSLLISFYFLFDYFEFSTYTLDVLAKHIACITGSITSFRLHNRGRWKKNSSTSVGVKWLQYILL